MPNSITREQYIVYTNDGLVNVELHQYLTTRNNKYHI